MKCRRRLQLGSRRVGHVVEAAAHAGLVAARARGLDEVAATLKVAATVARFDLAHVRHGGGGSCRTTSRVRRGRLDLFLVKAIRSTWRGCKTPWRLRRGGWMVLPMLYYADVVFSMRSRRNQGCKWIPE